MTEFARSTPPHRRVSVPVKLAVDNRLGVRQVVLDELERGGRRFLLDFARTTYIDSSGIGMLVSLARTLRSRGGERRLSHVNPDIHSRFEMIKLDTLIDVRGDSGAPSRVE